MSQQGPVIAIGSGIDPIFAGTVERLQARGVDHCVIDLDDNWPEYVSFDIALDSRVKLPAGERICVGDRAIALDDIRGLLLRFLAWAPEGTLGIPEGMFISNELSALFRFLSHRLNCPVINRLSPDLWAFQIIDGTQLKRMVQVDAGVCSATVYAATAESPEFAGAHHIPFSQPEQVLAVDELPDGALDRMVKTVPLRLMPRNGEELDTYIVGDAVHGSGAADAEIVASSREIASALDIPFCQMTWTKEEAGPVLQRVHLFPIVPYGISFPIEAVCDSIAQELTS